MSTAEAALAAATLAMTVVKNEANDNYGTWTWTVEQGAERFLEVMRNKGYALTPLAPEVPPRRDGLRERLLDIGTDHEDHRLRVIRDEPGDFPPSWVLACEDEDEAPALLDFAALERATPEPPDSGDGAAREARDMIGSIKGSSGFDPVAATNLHGDAGIDAALLRDLEARIRGLRINDNFGGPISGATVNAHNRAIEQALAQFIPLIDVMQPRSGSPAPEGGELLVGCPGCGKIVRRNDTRAGQHRPSIHRAAAPAEAREEGPDAKA